jgi:hypothetical protein
MLYSTILGAQKLPHTCECLKYKKLGMIIELPSCKNINYAV